jgi:hypothetical protein
LTIIKFQKNQRKEQRPVNTGFASVGLRANLKLCASIQVQCSLTVLYSEPARRKAQNAMRTAAGQIRASNIGTVAGRTFQRDTKASKRAWCAQPEK